MTPHLRLTRARALISAVSLGPVFIIFVSSNVVNAGNLLFNVLFSRWMGPELFGELATILTIKLAILGVLGAFQIAVSHRVAQAPASEKSQLDASLARLTHVCFVALWFALPVVIGLAWFGDLSGALGLGTPLLLTMLFLSLPFSLPLSILRGVAFGRLDTRHVLLTSNIEMVVRLVGAIIAWHLGFGLTGIVATIAISIVAGWLPLVRLLDNTAPQQDAWARMGRTMAVAAIPFAVLQASQVVLLDGDVVIARLFLDAREAGYIAALSLFQRIQFFACFGLASVLLPAVARATAEGQSALAPAAAVSVLFGCVSLVVLGAAAFVPEQVISLFVGPSFLEAAPLLLMAAASAVAFTLSYLLATFLSAVGDKSGIWMMAAACPLQILAMSYSASSLTEMLSIKVTCQFGLAALLVALAAWRTLQRWTPPTAHKLS